MKYRKLKKGVTSVRPWRMWRTQADRQHKPGNIPWRCYVHEKSALEHALLRVHEEFVGTVIDVYDIRTGKLAGTYRRHATGEITFRR